MTVLEPTLPTTATSVADTGAPATSTPTTSALLTAPPTTQPGDVTEIAVAPPLVGNSTKIVGIDTAGGLHVIDLTAATDTVFRFRPRLDGRRGLLPTGELLLAPSSVDGSSRLVGTDGSGTSIASVPRWIRSAAEPGRFWDLSDVEQGTVRVTDSMATATETRVSVPAGAFVVADPAGGLLVSDGDVTYRYSIGDVERVTDGTIEAAGVAHLLVRRCDAAECRLFAVDRVSNDEREVPRVLSPDDEFQLYGGSTWSNALVTMSADGRHAAFLAVQAEQYDLRVGLFDTVTGEFLVIAAGQNPDLYWSGDGRFAFVIDSLASGILTAFDIEAGEVVVVSRDLPPLETFTVLSA